MSRTRKSNDGALGGCLLVLALFVFLFVVMVAVAMWAWNAFAVPVFGMPTIDFAQAFAGFVLLTIVGGAFKSVFHRK